MFDPRIDATEPTATRSQANACCLVGYITNMELMLLASVRRKRLVQGHGNDHDDMDARRSMSAERWRPACKCVRDEVIPRPDGYGAVSAA